MPTAFAESDLTGERLVSFSRVAKRYPGRDHETLCVGAIRRWALLGVRGVRLEARHVAGQWVTSEEALKRFHAAVALTRRPPAAAGKPAARSERQRDREHGAAVKVLRARGLVE